MDKIDKTLKRLTDKEREQIKQLLRQLASGNLRGLNIMKLKGRGDVFRVRKGNLRVIYRAQGKEVYVLAIERRSEKTYKG
jgi:mRNA-degrading endonuclease RelE of RelBE toxin-antitoxin system